MERVLHGLQSGLKRDGFGSVDGGSGLTRKHHLLIGAACALALGYVLDIGPWPGGTERFLLPASAQDGQTATPAYSSGGQRGAPGPSAADESALRYFARQGDVDRLEAELRRLRALYPDWEPPTNLLDPVGEDQQVQQIWNLYGEGRYSQAREMIAQRQAQEPNWQPPEALLNALGEAEARERILNASKLEQWQAVINVAAEHPNLLVCSNVDILWRVAEAFAKTDRPERSYDAYAYVLQNCDNTSERVATVQKASEFLPDDQLNRLFQFGRTGPDGENEFASVRLDVIRREVGQAAEDPSRTVSTDKLQFLANEAATGRDSNDAALLGWYLYRHDNPQDGLEWFRFALENGHGVNAAQGFILSLRALNDEARAREAAYIWRNTSSEIMKIYLEAAATFLTGTDIYQVDQQAVSQFAPVVVDQRSANGAQALGWYAYNTCQFQTAEDWFITSANWKPSEAALFGLALARLRLGDTEGFEEVVTEWAPVYPAVRSLMTGENADPEAPSQAESPDASLQQSGVQQIDCGPIRQRMSATDRARPQTAAGTSQPMPITPARTSRTATPQRTATTTPERTATVRTMSPAPTAYAANAPRSAPVEAANEMAAAPARQTSGSFAVAAADTTTAPVATSGTREYSYSGYQVRGGQPTDQGIIYTGGAPNWGTDTSTATVLATGGPDVIAIDTSISSASAPSSSRLVDRAPAASPGVRDAYQSGDYRGCVGLTDASIRRGDLTGGDALTRGWCLLGLKRPMEAAMAFEAAYTTSYDRNRIADAAYGETLAKTEKQLTNQAAVAATKSPQPRTRRAEMSRDILTQRALAAYRDGKYAQAIMALDERSRVAPEQRDLMLLRGYAHYNLGQWSAAERIFKALDQAASTPDTRAAVEVLRFAREPQQRRF
ncbi:hypothetical protein [Amorphus orientalis]|uniref:Tetratricopeptide (TPR) repeat protein n=1 Tax=Amorphus orientalis TaxID=649198 RepID=A0AAE4AUJ7_9HYPH|nr:hypothetical protein [Amorphus orientalis]MDQ0317217.1 tetratricopeptide (TPR) repeat protein [Amorphus orientalis]